MASLITLESGRLGYGTLAHWVRQHGKLREPRGLKTYDAGHTVVVVRSPYDALPLGVGRSLLPPIGAAEAAQLVAGRARHALMQRISPTFRNYAEPASGFFHGAYGDRVGSQVAAVVRKIQSDRDTRQAVVTLWSPQLDNIPGKRDYPCTVALNFTVIDDQLELRTLMRSNDVWLGFPYDVFQFTQLQLTVARALGVEPGRYTHTAWSLHIYHEHVDLLDLLLPPEPIGPYQPSGFGRLDRRESWEDVRERAGQTLGLGPPITQPTESERWYVEQLGPYTTAA